jgi:site-specific recombinase XerD
LIVPIIGLVRRGSPATRLSTRGIRQIVDRYLTDLGLKRPGISAARLRLSPAAHILAEGCEVSEASTLFGVSRRTLRRFEGLLEELISQSHVSSDRYSKSAVKMSHLKGAPSNGSE